MIRDATHPILAACSLKMPHPTDLNLTAKDISRIASSDAVAAFLASLGYDTGNRKPLTPESIGLSGDLAAGFTSVKKVVDGNAISAKGPSDDMRRAAFFRGC